MRTYEIWCMSEFAREKEGWKPAFFLGRKKGAGQIEALTEFAKEYGCSSFEVHKIKPYKKATYRPCIKTGGWVGALGAEGWMLAFTHGFRPRAFFIEENS